jgi:hypothetical protein
MSRFSIAAAVLPPWFLARRAYLHFVAFAVIGTLIAGLPLARSPLGWLFVALAVVGAMPAVLAYRVFMILLLPKMAGGPVDATAGEIASLVGLLILAAVFGVLGATRKDAGSVAVSPQQPEEARRAARRHGWAGWAVGGVGAAAFLLLANLHPELLERPADIHAQAEMRSAWEVRHNLHDLISAEESYLADHGRYTDTLAALSFTPTGDVEIHLTLTDSASYVARSRSASSGLECAVWVGKAPADLAATEEGSVRCRSVAQVP